MDAEHWNTCILNANNSTLIDMTVQSDEVIHKVDRSTTYCVPHNRLISARDVRLGKDHSALVFKFFIDLSGQFGVN